MGVGYQASALHRIPFPIVDKDGSVTNEPPPGWAIPPIPNAVYSSSPARFRSPAVAEIIAWRDRLAAKYRGQLGEVVTWDEASEFVDGEDVGVSADIMLRYVAAEIDEGGLQSIRNLVDAEEPPHDEIARALKGVDGRGFTSQFPQLLLGPHFWLPFQRNMIIEEPDWWGRTGRFGSSFRLLEELRELKMLIAEADPHATEWTNNRDVPEKPLWAAWQASEAVTRICAAATSHHLPFWTTG